MAEKNLQAERQLFQTTCQALQQLGITTISGNNIDINSVAISHASKSTSSE